MTWVQHIALWYTTGEVTHDGGEQKRLRGFFFNCVISFRLSSGWAWTDLSGQQVRMCSTMRSACWSALASASLPSPPSWNLSGTNSKSATPSFAPERWSLPMKVTDSLTWLMCLKPFLIAYCLETTQPRNKELFCVKHTFPGIPAARFISTGCAGRQTPSSGLLTSFRCWRRRWRSETWGISSPTSSFWRDGIKAMYEWLSFSPNPEYRHRFCLSSAESFLPFSTDGSSHSSLWRGHGCGHRSQTENPLWSTKLGQRVRSSPQRKPSVRNK